MFEASLGSDGVEGRLTRSCNWSGRSDVSCYHEGRSSLQFVVVSQLCKIVVVFICMFSHPLLNT